MNFKSFFLVTFCYNYDIMPEFNVVPCHLIFFRFLVAVVVLLLAVASSTYAADKGKILGYSYLLIKLSMNVCRIAQLSIAKTRSYVMYMCNATCRFFFAYNSNAFILYFAECYAHSKGPGKAEGTCRPHCFGSELEIYEHNCGSSNRCCVSPWA